MIRGRRWQQVKKLLDECLDLPADERQAFLEQSCGADELLMQQVLSLLDEEERAGDFLQTPIFALDDTQDLDPTQELDETLVGDERQRPQQALSAAQDAIRRDGQRRIGPYRLIRQLGRGGMGTVYLARRDDDAYRSEVAIKVIQRRAAEVGAQQYRRFLVERQILADLNHPNIAELYDGGTIEGREGEEGDANDDGGLPYFVMELVDGVTLTEYCDRERLSVEARLELFDEVCSAVQAAHRSLIVHRDLKPANILVTEEGRPKLLDFGIAKPLDPTAFPQAIETTGSWQRPMTPIYASPEQIRGESVTTATDVYSLGVVLYELLTGRHPYRPWLEAPAGRSLRSIEDAVLHQPVPRPSDTVTQSWKEPASEATKGLPGVEEISRCRGVTPRQLRQRLVGDLDTIVLMALRKDPERRYTSVEQFAEDLKRYRQGLPVLARRDTAGYRLKKFVRRHRWGVGVTVVLSVLIVGFAISMALLAARLQESDRRARGLAEETASLAADLSSALQAKQQEEAQRKLAEAAQLSLQGQSEEAQRLRQDVEAAEAELSARTQTLEELRSQLSAPDDSVDLASESTSAELQATKNRLASTERQLAEAQRRAQLAELERNAAIDPADTSEQPLNFQDFSLASVEVPTRSTSVSPADEPPANDQSAPCRTGEEREERGFVFVHLCAGTFMRGSPSSDGLAHDDELPAHEVTLSEFWLGKFEVTNQQFRRWRSEHAGEATLPASTVNWTQARRFCKRFDFDLPTEAEWEYAARAGSTTRWFFGDSPEELGRYAWYEGNSSNRLHPVGGKLPNTWGLHDMYGNVWEWVADMWGPYSIEAKVNPTGPPVSPGSRRMVRGGAYDDPPRRLRSAQRGGTGPVFRRRDVGFRCVWRPDPSMEQESGSMPRP